MRMSRLYSAAFLLKHKRRNSLAVSSLLIIFIHALIPTYEEGIRIEIGRYSSRVKSLFSHTFVGSK